jgi:hypothetical protein
MRTLYLLSVLVVAGLTRAVAQFSPADTLHGNEHPKKAKLVVETDQRFTFFADSRNDQDRLQLISIWGARAGFLLPSNIKVGLGGYYADQHLNRTNLLPDAPTQTRRRLYALMAYAEPYWFRRKFWEFSTPVEVGWGHSRYTLTEPTAGDRTVLQGNFLPLGVGASVSFKFPPLRWFRPLRWFGVNLLGGYRFILRSDFPQAKVNYNGAYVSIGPIFFFDRFTDDFKAWKKRRKNR